VFEALANLVENATKFARDEGRVSLDLFRDATGFGITIANDGPGILPPGEDKRYCAASTGAR
jgi:signal transduction histidine kinase